MLKTRVITAVILLAIVLPVVLVGTPAQFGVLAAVVVGLAAWEWARVLGLSAAGNVPYALVTLAGVAFSYWARDVVPAQAWLKPAVIFWVLIGPYTLWRKPPQRGAWRAFLMLVGWIVLIAAWQSLWFAREQGVVFLLSILVIVWLADTGAYFSGKAFGRHKLAPSISPGKTWEGVAGGCILVLLAGAATLAGASSLPPTIVSGLVARFGLPGGALCLVLLVAYSIVGDLFESHLKRQAGVKDSSSLLPGHGGVLDRVDALLPVLPLALLMI